MDARDGDDADDGTRHLPDGVRKTTVQLEAEVMDKYLVKQQTKKEAQAAKAKAKAAEKATAKAADKAAAVAKASDKAAAKAADKAAVAKPKPKPVGGKPTLKRPAAAVSMWTGARKPPCPKAGDGPLDYKTARIYQSNGKRSFRIIRDRKDYSSERLVRWEGGKPDAASWKKGLAVVDEFQK